MTTIAIQLEDDQAERLSRLSQRLNVPVEQLALAQILELLSEPDEHFDAVARRVLEKNRELYRRLA